MPNITRPVKSLISLCMPCLFVILGMTINDGFGVIVGVIFIVYTVLRMPFACLPILMIAAAFQQTAQLGGLQVGWWIILGAGLSLVFKMFSKGHSVSINRKMLILMTIFCLVSFYPALTDQYMRFDRLGTLMILLIVIASLIGPIEAFFLNQNNIPKLFIIVCAGGVITLLYLIILVITGEAYLARGNELGLSIGVNESSPSGISRVLGFSLVLAINIFTSKNNNAIYNRTITLALSVCLFLGMIYTGSRMPVFAAIFTILLGLIVDFIFKRGKINKKNLLLLIIIILSVGGVSWAIMSGGAFNLSYISDSDFTLRVSREASVENNIRLDMWQNFFSELTTLKLMFGSGVGALHNPHSVFMGCISTFGVIGFMALLSLIISIYKDAVRYKSTIGFALMTYLIISYSSSSDVDRVAFWTLLLLVLLFIRADKYDFKLN